MVDSGIRLNEGEHVVVATRQHPKILLLPVLVLVVTLAVAAFADRALGGDGASGTAAIVIWVVAGLVIVWYVLRPLILWFTTSYTFTNRRFIKRSGLIAKQGRTIPLNRISGVDFEIGVIDRIFGCGTLVVSDASEQGLVELKDIPRVEEVQLRVADELHRLTEHRSDDGT